MNLRVRALAAAAAVVFTGGVAAAATHSPSPEHLVRANSAPAEVPEPSTSLATSTTAASVTTTTAPAATTAPPTTVRPTTTTRAAATPKATAAPPSTATTRPARPIAIAPQSVAPGGSYTVSGAGCQGSMYGVAITVKAPGGATVDGNGGEAFPDGSWSIPMTVQPSWAPGTYSVHVDCRDSQRKTIVFSYDDHPLTVT